MIGRFASRGLSECAPYMDAMAKLVVLACVAAALGGCSRGAVATPEQLRKLSALEAELLDLERQTQRAKDVSDIKRVQRAYGYYLDKALWDEAADLFVEHGSIEMGLDGVYVGKARVREYLYALGGGRAGLRHGQINEHMQLQPVITVAEDGLAAKGRWRALILGGQHGESAYWGEGPYENEYVKEDGVWKIAKLHWYQTFLVPYEGGWAGNEDLNGGRFVSQELPPDGPPTQQYETWPGVYAPAYHYENPVTGKR